MKISFKQLTLNGFTIVELIIVIVVIGILAAIGIVTYSGVQNRAVDKAVQSDSDAVANEVTRYSVNHNGTLGSAVAWYSGASANSNIQFTPTKGDVIDVVASANDWCIRSYNIVSSMNSITNAYLKGSSDLACATLPASVAAGGTGGAMIGWWKMNGSADSSVNVLNNGTVVGAVLGVGQDRLPNHAYTFASSYKQIVVNNIESVSTTLTLSAWVNPTAYPSERSAIINGFNPYSYYLSLANDGSLQSYWYNTSVEGYHSTAAGTVPLNQWTYVTATWDGTSMKLYTNGQLRKTDPVTGVGSSAGSVYIGAPESGARQFFGSIDDVRIYNRALAASELSALNTAGAQ